MHSPTDAPPDPGRCYLYAITDRLDLPPPGVPGLEDAQPVVLTCGALAAVVTPLRTHRLPATVAHVLQHEAVLEALMPDCTLLPLRFGTVLPDAAAVQTLLTHHHAACRASLERVRGCVELGIRALWRAAAESGADQPRPTGVATPPTSGRAYMLARLAEARQQRTRQQQAEALAATLHAPLAAGAVASTHHVLVTPRLLLTGAYLVHRDQVAAFRETVAHLAGQPTAAEVQLLATGPWPPYSFVNLDLPMPGAPGLPAAREG